MRVSAKKKAAVVIAPLLMVAIWWLSGFDFNERGIDAVGVALTTIAATVFVWGWPE
jgi:hypothetical protein